MCPFPCHTRLPRGMCSSDFYCQTFVLSFLKLFVTWTHVVWTLLGLTSLLNIWLTWCIRTIISTSSVFLSVANGISSVARPQCALPPSCWWTFGLFPCEAVKNRVAKKQKQKQTNKKTQGCCAHLHTRPGTHMPTLVGHLPKNGIAGWQGRRKFNFIGNSQRGLSGSVGWASDFGSGHDLRILGSSPTGSQLSRESASSSPSPSMSARSLSLSNELLKSLKNK